MKLLTCMIMLLSLVACGDEPEVAEKDTGREETRKIEAAGAVGYDGKALRDSVDKVLDDSEARNKKLEEANGSEFE